MKDAGNSEAVDRYIAEFSDETRSQLERIRAVIRKAAPTAKEVISYGIPTYVLDGNLVHFGGYKHHIGFYPAPSAIRAFSKNLSAYKGAKGSVQFPVNDQLPTALIEEIVRFRVAENTAKAVVKSGAEFLFSLSAPVRRALEAKGITSAKKLAAYSEDQILSLHGVGPASLPKLKQALEEAGLTFKA